MFVSDKRLVARFCFAYAESALGFLFQEVQVALFACRNRIFPLACMLATLSELCLGKYDVASISLSRSVGMTTVGTT